MNDKSALVVIPTTGSNTLRKAIQSVLSQTYQNTELWVIIDGPEFQNSANAILKDFPTVKKLELIANTGKPDWYGHRIYAAVSFLFNHDYILYLDQDNWFMPNHVEKMVKTCEENNLHWCYSLRKIYNADETYVCDDDCESLGKYPIYLSDKHHLVDTSSYCIRKDVIVNFASAWYGNWGGDRRFLSIISQHAPKYDCTGYSTACYRLDGNPNSVTSDFFIKGNEIMKQRYPLGFPWRKN